MSEDFDFSPLEVIDLFKQNALHSSVKCIASTNARNQIKTRKEEFGIKMFIHLIIQIYINTIYWILFSKHHFVHVGVSGHIHLAISHLDKAYVVKN